MDHTGHRLQSGLLWIFVVRLLQLVLQAKLYTTDESFQFQKQKLLSNEKINSKSMTQTNLKAAGSPPLSGCALRDSFLKARVMTLLDSSTTVGLSLKKVFRNHRKGNLNTRRIDIQNFAQSCRLIMPFFFIL